jgi:hypothetical protein
VTPFTGCTVKHRTHSGRDWIIWNKKGFTVTLVESLETIGPHMEMACSFYDCEFVSISRNVRAWMT